MSEQAYPEVTLEIIADTLLIDIVGAGVDAGVRFEEHLAEDIVAVSRSRPQRYVVASPALLAARGQPSAPKDLHAQPCIATRCPSGLLPAWEFEKAGRTLKIMPRGPLVSSSPTLLLRAAIDGLGFLMTF